MKPEHLQKTVELRHQLHRHPDLSLKEAGTIRILMDFLRANTSFELVGRDGWFYAVRRGKQGAGIIGFRADMDALPMDEELDLPYGSLVPGISHKCGHDGHCAVLCGLAMELESRDTDRTVFLIFQPAEEIGAGGKACAAECRDLGIQEIYAFHNLSGYPEGMLVFRNGLTQPASEGLTIRFSGKPSHASAPEEGKNPSEAIADTVLYIRKLLEKDWDGMVLCTVTGMNAGTGDFGISAGTGSLMLTLRAEREAEMHAMETEILRYVQQRAGWDGIHTDSRISDYFPETRNNREALGKVIACAARTGMSSQEMGALWRASEDFGYYLKEIPGAMFYIGNGGSYPALHTPGYDFNDRILEPAVDLFAEIARAYPVQSPGNGRQA